MKTRKNKYSELSGLQLDKILIFTEDKLKEINLILEKVGTDNIGKRKQNLPFKYLNARLCTINNFVDLLLELNAFSHTANYDLLKKIILKYYGSFEWEFLGHSIYNPLWKWAEKNNIW